MTLLRRLPLFVPIGLAWWLGLVAWPASRPLILRALPIPAPSAEDLPFWPASVLFAILWLLACFGAAWLAVRVLVWFEAGRSWGSFAWWTLVTGWFALAAGSFVILLVWTVLPALAGGQLGAALGCLIQALFISLVTLPALAFLVTPLALCIVAPLAAATVLSVRRWGPRRQRVDGFGRPIAPAG